MRSVIGLTVRSFITIIVVMNEQYITKLPAEWVRISRVYMALGDAHRQHIMLLFEPAERLSISQIAEVMPLSRTAVVHHLRILRDTGVLVAEREGKSSYYRVNRTVLTSALQLLLGYVEQHP